MRDFTKVAMLLTIGLSVACGGGEAPPAGEGMETAEAPAAAEPANVPRVFFIAPQDGAQISVDIPVVFEFGSENFEISPVPQEAAASRSGVGHYHLGVDTECLPAGEIIPQGDPWVHFGDGSNTIEMFLEPGEHTFVVQIGDDEHRTLEGLCSSISIEIAEGI